MVTWPPLSAVTGAIRGAIDGADHIGCLAHKDADADSLGSALAFADSLRALGRQVHPMVPSPRPRLLDHLPGFGTLEEAPHRIDVLFTFDCATVERFGDRRDLIGTTATVVNVDHHASNQGFGTINLVDPHASATGEVVYHLLRALGAPISAAAATNLYAALLTDTGGFRHENTTEAALRLAADLTALGADPGWIAMKSYKSRTVPQLQLEAASVAALHSELEGSLIWSEITTEMLARVGAGMQDSEGVIDQLQSIDTMMVAILFKEKDQGHTKISVRSRDPIDATALCRPFGGGGHHRAAGAEMAAPLAEAESRVLGLARELVAQGSARPSSR